MKHAILLLLGCVLAVAAHAQVPTPKPRPADPAPSRRAPAIERPRADPAISAGPNTPCTDLLAEGIAVAEIEDATSGLSGDALCGDEAPARLSAVKMTDGSRVEIRPAALVRCEIAGEFARWVRIDLATAARHAGVRLRRIEVAASYSCRPRNNVKGARISEHAFGNAIDVSAIVLADGRTIDIDAADAPAIFLASMRATACARFTTVLGPGADAAHAHHIHLDLARRRGGYRLCQWNMPAWPLP